MTGRHTITGGACDAPRRTSDLHSAGELLAEAAAWRDRVRTLAEVDPEVLTSAGVLSGANRGEYLRDLPEAADRLDAATFALSSGTPLRFGGAA